MANQKKENQAAGVNPAGLLIGVGIGLCFGTAMGNMAAGIGIGLCFCVALGHKPEEKQ